MDFESVTRKDFHEWQYATQYLGYDKIRKRNNLTLILNWKWIFDFFLKFFKNEDMMHDFFLERNVRVFINTSIFFLEMKSGKNNFLPFYFGRVNRLKPFRWVSKRVRSNILIKREIPVLWFDGLGSVWMVINKPKQFNHSS